MCGGGLRLRPATRGDIRFNVGSLGVVPLWPGLSPLPACVFRLVVGPMASTKTRVTRAAGDVTHCLPPDMKWVKTLKVQKLFGSNLTGLRATFKEKCPKCSKARDNVSLKFGPGLTVEDNLLPKLRKKLRKCCAKEFQSAARRAAIDGIFDPRAAKKRRRQDSTARLEGRVAALQAELASTKKELAAARKSATKQAKKADYESRAVEFDDANRCKWSDTDRTKRTAARGLEMHLKSLCGGSVLLRDEFLADLADRCKTKGVVMVKQDEHAHLVKCKAVCANLHQSVQILKQCRNKSERRAYNTVSLAVSCGCTGRAGRTCGTLPPMPSVSQLHSHGPSVTARSLSVLLSAIHDCRRWYRTHP